MCARLRIEDLPHIWLFFITHKSESQLQTQAFPYVSVFVVLFLIFVALKISSHVEKGVVTPSLGFKTNGPAQKTILTGTRALFLRRQYYAKISI